MRGSAARGGSVLVYRSAVPDGSRPPATLTSSRLVRGIRADGSIARECVYPAAQLTAAARSDRHAMQRRAMMRSAGSPLPIVYAAPHRHGGCWRAWDSGRFSGEKSR